ncbi:Protein N-terminal amidase [Lachnellula occidentalis]|uniref:Protein N-terminal amidase n=1 Tax=Lachnellula occidentalis TaxID=215460 RepID=A0A8H8S7I7_9HELO|nr:Protein N-terminal amidase [Lachnellula occidentalis]
MRIACLQFAPQVGDVDNNLNRADAVLSRANIQNIDLLVLPELAFSGYNFKSLQHISPFLEPTTAGITSLWARTTALKYDCVVTVGYPEKVDITPKWPASPEYYNSAITVNADGETIANYRKSFLYYTDETWALEGPDGFFDGEIDGLGNVAMGICKWPTKSFERMDLNPYKFESPWSAWEFAHHILHKEANLVILSMAWLTREDPRAYSRTPKEPDMETLSYWLARMEPLIRAETEGEIIVVFANRCGIEGEAVYAGTSAVLGIHGGEVKVYGILGRGEKELLVIDTTKRPQAKLISQPSSSVSNAPVDEKDFSRIKGANRDTSISNPKTNSTNSETSIGSINSKLSVETKSTACTTPDAIDSAMTEDIITPLSPVDATSPSAFFAPKGRKVEGETLRENLKSSIGRPDFSSAKPDSPTFARPPSPKSRNASRTRQIEQPDLNSAEPDSPTFVRPPSPKSRNASRTRQPELQGPALASHDLAQDPQITLEAFGVKSPPNSASTMPDQFDMSFPGPGVGRRSLSTSPRPKSTVW